MASAHKEHVPLPSLRKRIHLHTTHGDDSGRLTVRLFDTITRVLGPQLLQHRHQGRKIVKLAHCLAHGLHDPQRMSLEGRGVVDIELVLEREELQGRRSCSEDRCRKKARANNLSTGNVRGGDSQGFLLKQSTLLCNAAALRALEQQHPVLLEALLLHNLPSPLHRLRSSRAGGSSLLHGIGHLLQEPRPRSPDIRCPVCAKVHLERSNERFPENPVCVY